MGISRTIAQAKFQESEAMEIIQGEKNATQF